MQLIDYEQYVLSAKLVDPKKIGFYSRWVKRFLKMDLSDQLSDSEKVNQFSESMAADPDIEDWQEKQSKHAVEIYLNLFLKHVHSEASSDNPDAFKYIDEIKTAMRLA